MLIKYVCNLCEKNNQADQESFNRELTACSSCGSIPRFRGLISILSQRLFGKSISLTKMAPNKKIKGLGFTDAHHYAKHLAKLFNYTNTFYETEPKLDICKPVPAAYMNCDFVICSEVFEHLPCEPLNDAFKNLFSLLKPGGLLLFSVPTTDAENTIEHYPELHDFAIVPFGDEQVLINRARNGALSAHDKLVFHGGGVTALEMRLYSESDVMRRLKSAGFTDIEILSEPELGIGVYWPPHAIKGHADIKMRAYLFVARRPV